MTDSGMNARRVVVRAPSNIALVKYMGKTDAARNLPANPSLSMTLSDLCTAVELRAGAGPDPERVSWVSELPSGLGDGASHRVPDLSSSARSKFTDHVRRFQKSADELYDRAGLLRSSSVESLEIRSSNSFPHSSGIASSASSLAALTVALFVFHAKDPGLARHVFEENLDLRQALARLSRQGSGSSCRSFHGPYTAWEEEEVRPVSSSLPPLRDLVCILSDREKKVSSSEAHRRVITSSLWAGRVERAEARFRSISAAIESGDFQALTTTVYEEALDMHELFHTAAEPFSYLTDQTRELLRFLRAHHKNDTILTLDAGPNVHVLVREQDRERIRDSILAFDASVRILGDGASSGPEVLGVET